MGRLCIVVVAVLLGLSGQVASADGEVECEHAKLNTEDATPVEPGSLETSLSWSLSWAHRALDNDWSRCHRPYYREQDFGLSLKYGLMEDLDVGLELGYADIYDRDTAQVSGGGLMDLAVGAKWRFYKDEDAGLEIAYVPSVTFPTGKDGTAGRLGASDEFTTLFNGIAISKDWGGRWTSGLDLGYAYPIGGKRDGYRGTLSSDVALGYQWTESVQPEIELNYTHDFNHGADADSLAATVGLIICLRDDLRLDVGVQRALAGRNCDLGTTCIVALTYTR